jgi:hypothetical protein
MLPALPALPAWLFYLTGISGVKAEMMRQAHHNAEAPRVNPTKRVTIVG